MRQWSVIAGEASFFSQNCSLTERVVLMAVSVPDSGNIRQARRDRSMQNSTGKYSYHTVSSIMIVHVSVCDVLACEWNVKADKVLIARQMSAKAAVPAGCHLRCIHTCAQL